MEAMKRKWKKYITFKGLGRSRSIVVKDHNHDHDHNHQSHATNTDPNPILTRQSKSWNGGGTKYKPPPAPDGCFPVYVGPDKQRFVVKAKFANHPLFAMLLEDAELEYGYNSQGPILLPCDVGLFYQVLAEMDSGDDRFSNHYGLGEGGYGTAALMSCSPLRLTRCGSKQGHGGYRLLSPSPMLKLN